MFPHTITVYNIYRNANGVEQFQRTVLRGVYWNAIKGATMRKTGIQSADGFVVIIPKGAESSRSYVGPVAFSGLADKSEFYTLQNGDYLVKGDTGYDIQKSPKELSRFDDVCRATAVDAKLFGSGLDHWEVTGK